MVSRFAFLGVIGVRRSLYFATVTLFNFMIDRSSTLLTERLDRLGQLIQPNTQMFLHQILRNMEPQEPLEHI